MNSEFGAESHFPDSALIVRIRILEQELQELKERIREYLENNSKELREEINILLK